MIKLIHAAESVELRDANEHWLQQSQRKFPNFTSLEAYVSGEVRRVVRMRICQYSSQTSDFGERRHFKPAALVLAVVLMTLFGTACEKTLHPW